MSKQREKDIEKRLLQNYFDEISTIDCLSREEEKELSDRIKMGDGDAINELVKHNLRFVVNIAKEYKSYGLPLNDLISEGNMGLIRAAEKFDADRGVKFISYAVWWIKSFIGEYINTHALNKSDRIDDYIEFGKDGDLDDNDANEMFEQELSNIHEKRDGVKELLKCLRDRELKILTMFFGLDGEEEMTLEDIGKKTQLTMERVRQIKDEALIKLKCETLSLSSEDIEGLKSMRG